MKFENSRRLQETAHRLIPGGCHTYAKGDDQFPAESPGFIVRGKGCQVWDADGNAFIEYGMGLRSVTLGHAFEPVVEAACRQMLLGNNYTRPATIEVACAERLLSLVGGDQVKFTKDGSTATTAAVKLARAVTGREMVALCGDHPFFSYDDWFIGTTAIDSGVLDDERKVSVKFRYNDLDSLSRVFDQHPGRVACVIMEPGRADEPREGYLADVRDLAHKNGSLFVLDEMITGFRYHLGGAQALYGVEADLATFGKGLANGFSLSALTGREEIMELGGIKHDRERVFLLSTTHGAENHSLAAAMATMDVYEDEDVVGFLHNQGERLRVGATEVAASAGVQEYFEIAGRDCNLYFVTRDADGKPSQEYRTVFLQELIRRSIIAPSFVVSYSHTDDIIDQTIEAVGHALGVYRRALDDGAMKHLVGRAVKPVYRKFNHS